MDVRYRVGIAKEGWERLSFEPGKTSDGIAAICSLGRLLVLDFKEMLGDRRYER